MASAPSSSSGGGGDSSTGSNPCPICLEPVKQQEAYLDGCFHSFCFDCILSWSIAVAKKHRGSPSSLRCPLCKAESFSIIHGFNGEFFQRYYINQNHGKSCLSSAHEFRLQSYNIKAEILNNIWDVRQYWKHRRYLRKNIWFQSWLRREIQALIQDDDVDIIVHHIHGAVESFFGRTGKEDIRSYPEQKREEFRELLYNAARPFLIDRTKGFLDQVELFLASGLNLEAYDKVCMEVLGSSLPGGHDEESNDVQALYAYNIDEDHCRTD